MFANYFISNRESLKNLEPRLAQVCIVPLHIVVCCCKLNNTRDCDEHFFGQVSTRTGCYQLPIFRCTNVHPRRYARPYLGTPFIDDVMRHNTLIT